MWIRIRHGEIFQAWQMPEVPEHLDFRAAHRCSCEVKFSFGFTLHAPHPTLLRMPLQNRLWVMLGRIVFVECLQCDHARLSAYPWHNFLE